MTMCAMCGHAPHPASGMLSASHLLNWFLRELPSTVLVRARDERDLTTHEARVCHAATGVVWCVIGIQTHCADIVETRPAIFPRLLQDGTVASSCSSGCF